MAGGKELVAILLGRVSQTLFLEEFNNGLEVAHLSTGGCACKSGDTDRSLVIDPCHSTETFELSAAAVTRLAVSAENDSILILQSDHTRPRYYRVSMHIHSTLHCVRSWLHCFHLYSGY